MEHVFVARQSIFDRTQTVRGYELLYRTGFIPRAPVEDGETATARVALSALTEVGLDRIVGERSAWLSVTPRFLLEGLARSLPARRVVLELLERPVAQKLRDQLRDVRGDRYEFALTSVSPTTELEPLRGLVGSSSWTMLRSARRGLKRLPSACARKA